MIWCTKHTFNMLSSKPPDSIERNSHFMLLIIAKLLKKRFLVQFSTVPTTKISSFKDMTCFASDTQPEKATRSSMVGKAWWPQTLSNSSKEIKFNLLLCVDLRKRLTIQKVEKTG